MAQSESTQPSRIFTEQSDEDIKQQFENQIKDFCWKDDEEGDADNSAPKLASDCPRYSYNNDWPGMALVIHNDTFKSEHLYLEDSYKDRDNFVKTFKALGFHVAAFDNLTKVQMDIVAELASYRYKHLNANYFVSAIISHGKERHENGGIYHDVLGSDEEPLDTNGFISNFDDCPGLEHKPKLFFIQACRGLKHDPGVYVTTMCSEGEDDEPMEQQQQQSNETSQDAASANPSEPDSVVMSIRAAGLFRHCLIMYAASPGHRAYVRGAYGSWFIQKLCETLDKFSFQVEDGDETVSLLSVLSSVSNEVARCFETMNSNAELCGKKQMPVIETMLMRDVRVKWKTK